jgi:glycosyltransferase involved in cell wall biosynthesis
MHIAWIVYGRIDQPTGGYVYDRMIVDGLVACGHSVEVVSIAPGEDARARIKDAQIVVGDELCFAEVGPAFRALEGAVEKRILLVHHLTRWETESAPSAALLEGEASALASSDVVVATSGSTAARLEREALARDVVVVEPGADRLPLVPRRAESVRLLFAGALTPRKGLATLVEVLEELADPRVSLIAVGEPRDPAYAREVRATIAASPTLSARVTLTGAVSDDALANELAHADAVVLPSTFEGYGMIVAEAIRAGVPVIAADVGEARRICGGAGIVFAAGSRDALRDALRRFAADAAL